MRQILLSESHPEARPLDRGIVLDERLQLLVIDHVRLALADARVAERLVDLVRLGHDPLSVLVVTALLGHLADVDLGVEVRGEGHTVVAGVAIDDVEVVDFVEMVLGGIGREDGRNARVETAA